MPVKNINAEELQAFINKGDVEIIDIRDAREYDVVHLKNSKLIPMQEILDRVNDIDWNKKVILVCRSGGRSLFIAQQLSNLGKQVYNLEHGLLECYQNKTKYDLETQQTGVEKYFI
jgi:adenylyltransferase/sulfurtransferase